MTQISARKICCWGFSIPIHIHTDYRGPVGERDGTATLSRGECLWEPPPLPQVGSSKSLALTSLYRFFRPLTSKKVLFTIQRFVLGGYLCRHRTEGVSEYVKGGHLHCKRRNGQTAIPIPGGSSPDSVKIKIPSKHLLASGWGSFFF